MSLPRCELCGGLVYRRLTGPANGQLTATGPLWHLDMSFLDYRPDPGHEPVVTDAPEWIPLSPLDERVSIEVRKATDS